MDTQMNGQMETVNEGDDKLIAQIAKSDYDEVRVRERQYKGKEYVDIRIFLKRKSGAFIPTKKGVTLPKEMIKDLRKSLVHVV